MRDLTEAPGSVDVECRSRRSGADEVHVVFEYHAVDGYGPKLDRIMGRLSSAGYALREERQIVSAWRP